MKRILFTGILIILITAGCNSVKLSDKIQGVWVFESKTDTTILVNRKAFTPLHYPMLYHFTEKKELKYIDYTQNPEEKERRIDSILQVASENLEEKEYIKFEKEVAKSTEEDLPKWSLGKDSLLLGDSLHMKVIKLNDSSLHLLKEQYPVSYSLFLHKAQNTTLKFNPDEIKNILVSQVWKPKDAELNKTGVQIEYMDNGIMLYKQRVYDPSIKDSTMLVQIENWKISEYLDYKFLTHIKDNFNKNTLNELHQILSIDPYEFTLSNSYKSKVENKSFEALNLANKRNEIKKMLSGKWNSINTSDKPYGTYAYDSNGAYALYQGTIEFTFRDQIMTIKLEGLDPFVYSWDVSKDGKTLLLEFNPEAEWVTTNIFYPVNLIQISPENITLRLFDNNFPIGDGYTLPKGYYVNLIQNLKRTDTANP